MVENFISIISCNFLIYITIHALSYLYMKKFYKSKMKKIHSKNIFYKITLKNYKPFIPNIFYTLNIIYLILMLILLIFNVLYNFNFFHLIYPIIMKTYAFITIRVILILCLYAKFTKIIF